MVENVWIFDIFDQLQTIFDQIQTIFDINRHFRSYSCPNLYRRDDFD